MSNKLTLLPICVLAFVLAMSAQGVEVYTQTLKALASDPYGDAFLASRHITTLYPHIFRKLKGNHALITPPNVQFTQSDQIVFDQMKEKLSTSEYGALLLQTANTNGKSLELRLFHDMPLEDGFVNEDRPTWVNDEMVHHELAGAYSSRGRIGLIALNNNQPRASGTYTFAHELFHLLDNNDQTGDFDYFLAEYRALLTEAVVHLQIKMASAKSSDVNLESEEHEKLLDKPILGIGATTVDTKKVFEHTLNLLYPENPRFKIDAVLSLENSNWIRKTDTYAIIKSAIVKILNGRDDLNPVVLQFTEDPKELETLAKENKEMRERIKEYFNRSQNKNLLSVEMLKNLHPMEFNRAGNGDKRVRNGPGG